MGNGVKRVYHMEKERARDTVRDEIADNTRHAMYEEHEIANPAQVCIADECL